MTRILLILFIILTFITHPIGEYDPSGNPILGRLTYGDFFGLLALLFGIKYLFEGFILSMSVNKIYIYSMVFVLTLFIGVFFSLNQFQTIIETSIHLFLILLSILIFYVFKDKLFSSLFPVIIITTITASLFGFYDLLADLYGYPKIFSSRTEAEAVSGFRNAGQAGAYFMVMLTILFPLWKSNLKNYLPLKYRKLLIWAIFLGILFLFTTGKIAGYIGFVTGYTLYTLFNPKFKNIFSYLLIAVAFVFLFYNLETIYPKLYKRLNNRIETRIVQQVEGTSRSNFFQSNWGGAVEAFKENPLTGSGIGGFSGVLRQYEVHSTYLKILGETGLVGIIGYLLFIFAFFSLFKRYKFYDNETYKYIKYTIPFVIGDLVSWTYTYHMRKREFWILISIFLIIIYQSKLKYYKKNARKNL
jgi:O-antigen ligase